MLEKKQRGPKRKAVSIVLGDDADADADAAEGRPRPSKRIASASASTSASHNAESQSGSQSQLQALEEGESQRYMFEETMQDSITTSVRGGAATSKIKLRPPPPPTDSQEEDAHSATRAYDGGGVKSSSPLRPPARGDLLDFSSSPVHPSSDRPFAPSSIAPRSSPPPPSSPTAAAAQQQRGSKRKASATGAEDWNAGDEEVEAEAEEGGAQKGKVRIDPTATYYEVVSIIRKKIVFSKRPEPIVRLEKFA